MMGIIATNGTLSIQIQIYLRQRTGASIGPDISITINILAAINCFPFVTGEWQMIL
jgi:hypothetical protein